MIITNNSRRQARATFNRIIAGFHGWIYRDINCESADNGQVTVYIRENNDLVYQSNCFLRSTLLGKLTSSMRKRILNEEEEEKRERGHHLEMYGH